MEQQITQIEPEIAGPGALGVCGLGGRGGGGGGGGLLRGGGFLEEEGGVGEGIDAEGVE